MEKRHQAPSSPSSTGTDEVQFNKRVGGDDHLVPDELKDKTVCIIGLGYVGLPLAEAFSRHLKTIGFDIDGKKLEGLKRDNNEEGLELTTNFLRKNLVKPSDIRFAQSDYRLDERALPDIREDGAEYCGCVGGCRDQMELSSVFSGAGWRALYPCGSVLSGA